MNKDNGNIHMDEEGGRERREGGRERRGEGGRGGRK